MKMKPQTEYFLQLLTLTVEELLEYIPIAIADYGTATLLNPHKPVLYISSDPQRTTRKPLLLAHLDIIGTIPPSLADIQLIDGRISLKPKDQRISQCRVLGGDDRCGVFIILELIKAGYLAHYDFLLTTDEEVGGMSADIFAQQMNPNIFSCFISLDRESSSDYAEYGPDNSELASLFESRGYHRAMGSFTDCLTLSAACTVACGNLSVGYYYQHTDKEYIIISQMLDTLKTLKDQTLIKALSHKVYTYNSDQSYRSPRYFSYLPTPSSDILNSVPVVCEDCGVHEPLYSLNGILLCRSCIEEPYTTLDDEYYLNGYQPYYEEEFYSDTQLLNRVRRDIKDFG
jgi:hypothetical protein